MRRVSTSPDGVSTHAYVSNEYVNRVASRSEHPTRRRQDHGVSKVKTTQRHERRLNNTNLKPTKRGSRATRLHAGSHSAKPVSRCRRGTPPTPTRPQSRRGTRQRRSTRPAILRLPGETFAVFPHHIPSNSRTSQNHITGEAPPSNTRHPSLCPPKRTTPIPRRHRMYVGRRVGLFIDGASCEAQADARGGKPAWHRKANCGNHHVARGCDNRAHAYSVDLTLDMRSGQPGIESRMAFVTLVSSSARSPMTRPILTRLTKRVSVRNCLAVL